MDYIRLAEELGVSKDIAIKVYRSFNGGYFIQLYYAKPPFLYKLRNWPKLYLNFKNYHLFTNHEFDKAFTILVYSDIFSIYGMSYYLQRKSLDLDKIRGEVKEVFREIEIKASEQRMELYPRLYEEEIQINAEPLIKDLVKKRLDELNSDLIVLLNEIVYDSKIMDEIKKKYPWAKGVKRENSIRAVSLAGMLDQLIQSEFDVLVYLASSRSLYFDELLLANNISTAISTINSLNLNNFQYIANEKLKNELNKLINIIKEIAEYY